MKQNSSQRHESSPAEMHLRCPQCYKLYVVQAKTVCTDKPEFQCTQCTQVFWVNFPEALEFSEVVAFPTEWNQDYQSEGLDADAIARQSFSEELDSELLSKMNYEKIWHSQIDFKENSDTTKDELQLKNSAILEDQEHKPRPLNETSSENDQEVGSQVWALSKEWEKVLNNYEVTAYHEGFLEEVLKQDHLEFAYQKYKSIKEVNPHDTMACERLKKIEAMMQNQAGAATTSDSNAALVTPGKSKLKVNVKASKGLQDYYKYLPWISLALAISLIIVGFMSEPLNHLAGFGFAIIFLTGALSLLKESDL